MASLRFMTLLISLIFIASCRKEVQHNIPIEFKEYVTIFFNEAESRGSNLHLCDVSLSVKFANLPSGRAAQCKSSKHLIEVNEQAWESYNHLKKEHLIAHELGHCILNRKHRNILTSSGEDVSIMQGDRIGSFNFASKKWRKYYYDELFFPEELLPIWHYSKIQNLPTINQVLTDITNLTTNKILIDTVTFSSFENFSINVKFKNWRTSVEILELTLGNISLLYADNGGVKVVNDSCVLYTSSNMALLGDIEFNIIKTGQYVFFLVNDNFYHVMEYELISGETLLIDFIHNSVDVDLRIKI